MGRAAEIRRIRADEWPAMRALRLEAVQDPDAAIAFLETYEGLLARDESFWRDRARRAAESDEGAQFVATDAGEWVGSLTVLLRTPGTLDHLGRGVDDARADVVGVYVRPTHRGEGVIDALLAAGTGWATAQGAARIELDVHTDNSRARAAYRRCGFSETGERLQSTIGDEVKMRWTG